MIKIGIIGGSGLDNPNLLQEAEEMDVETPFGKPSSSLKIGKINGVKVVLLARHGSEHTIPPSQVNYRANIQALKDAGCSQIIATTACGSLKEEVERGDLVILDQFIDFTRHRKISFFEEFIPNMPAHTPMAEPFCPELRAVLIENCEKLGLKHHKTGTVITIEGPRFSTKAESRMFQLFGADVINMSIAPEAILAKEAEIPYAAIAMSTDYDCWKESEESVSWNLILETFKKNVEKVTTLLVETISQMGAPKEVVSETKEESPAEIKVPKEETPDQLYLKSFIRTVPNWPKPGVTFRDVTTLIKDPEAFAYVTQQFKEKYQNQNITKIAGIEARGFIFGAALAHQMNLPFIPIRKKGKLPAETVSQEYELEYGTDKIEMHKDAISPGENVLVIDDLCATGGTLLAACKLVEKIGGIVAGCAFVINLPELKGLEKLKNYPTYYLMEFEGE